MEPVDRLHRTSFMHPVSEHKAVVEAARAEHIPLSLLIRRALQAELKKIARAQARRNA